MPNFGREPAPVAVQEPVIRSLDRAYTRYARLYDVAARRLPLWRRWLEQALPHIQGPRVLEVSFGTGYLLTRYAGRVQGYGVDYNERMVCIARQNLARSGTRAHLQRADVAALPYASAAFDSVVNTMAFSGYPNGMRAISELARVLRPGGRLILVDVNFPGDGNRLGMALARMWVALGDTIRDMQPLFQAFGFNYRHEQIGGFGSVHLYVAHKSAGPPGTTSPD